MAEKKTNEIIQAQRKARQDFLDLKKMQSGEMYAGPKPSETATVLKTPREKFQHFWLYNKWRVIISISVTVLIAIMVAQCVSKPDYDLKVVYFTYKPALDEQTSLIADYLDDYVEDVTENGKVEIQVINCSISMDSNYSTNRNATLQRLQAVIAADKSTMLFITNEESQKYFDAIKTDNITFLDEDLVELGEDFYKATTHKSFGPLADGLELQTRRIEGTVLESKDEVSKYHSAAKKAIANIQNSQKDN